MDELENLHADRTNIGFYHYGSGGRGLGSCKASFSVFVMFGPKLHKQIVAIPMGTNCDPLMAVGSVESSSLLHYRLYL